MSNDYNTFHNETGPELQGSILWGVLGSATGMIVCILVMLLCSLFRLGSFSTMLQLFVGLVIGWFYRLFHGRRSFEYSNDGFRLKSFGTVQDISPEWG